MSLRTLVLGGASAIAALSAVSASALTVQLEDLTSGDTVTVSDGDAADAALNAGAVTFIGAVGGGTWSFNVTTGVNSSGVSVAAIDLNSVNSSSTGPGSLRVSLSTAGLSIANPTGLDLLGTFSIGGTTQGSVTAQTFYSNADFEFDRAFQIGSTLGAFSPIAFSGSTSAIVGAVNTFSLTTDVFIDHAGNGLTSFDALTTVAPVPVPAALPLLASALGLIGYLGRRRKAA